MFEFVDHTALDELERFPNGAEECYVKKIMWQVLKGVEFCHVNNVRNNPVYIFHPNVVLLQFCCSFACYLCYYVYAVVEREGVVCLRSVTSFY